MTGTLGESSAIDRRGAPAKVFRTEMNPVDLLARAASMYAEKSAVVHGDRRYTYAEFGERAWRLANGLRAAGLRKGDRVATLLPNCPAMLEAQRQAGQQQYGANGCTANGCQRDRQEG